MPSVYISLSDLFEEVDDDDLLKEIRSRGIEYAEAMPGGAAHHLEMAADVLRRENYVGHATRLDDIRGALDE